MRISDHCEEPIPALATPSGFLNLVAFLFRSASTGLFSYRIRLQGFPFRVSLAPSGLRRITPAQSPRDVEPLSCRGLRPNQAAPSTGYFDHLVSFVRLLS